MIAFGDLLFGAIGKVDKWLLVFWFQHYYVLPTNCNFIISRIVKITEHIPWHGYIFESVKLAIRWK